MSTVHHISVRIHGLKIAVPEYGDSIGLRMVHEKHCPLLSSRLGLVLECLSAHSCTSTDLSVHPAYTLPPVGYYPSRHRRRSKAY